MKFRHEFQQKNLEFYQMLMTVRQSEQVSFNMKIYLSYAYMYADLESHKQLLCKAFIVLQHNTSTLCIVKLVHFNIF